MPRTTYTAAQRAQFYAYILTAAIEGGINYWAGVEAYHWRKAGAGTGLVDEDMDTRGCYAVILDQEAHAADWSDGAPQWHQSDAKVEGRPNVYRVTPAVLRRGLARILDGTCTWGGQEWEVKGRAAYFVAYGGNDAGDIDAGRADNIVQAGLWGDIIYG